MNNLNFKLPDKIKNKKDIIIFHNHENICYYRDNIWSVQYFTDRKVRFSGNINFEKIFSNGENLIDNKILLETYKDILYKLINSGLKIKTIKNHSYNIFFFLDYVYSELKINNINLLTENQINSYIDYLIKKKISYNTIREKLSIIKNSFFKFRNELDFRILFPPFNNINITKKLRTKNISQHKQTELIPDENWKIIINKCQRYILNYNNNKSETIILDKYKKVLNDNKTTLRNNYKNIELHSSSYKTRKEHIIFIKNVQISCAIIIQAFTGMRVSELLSLSSDCLIEENIIIETKDVKILKIKGKTYKYIDKDCDGKENGKEVFWICPPIVKEAVMTLNKINKGTNYYLLKNNINNNKLFLTFQTFSKRTNFDVDIYYKRYLKENDIEIDFKLTPHSFRRTFARFLARSINEIPIESIKEQFKHYSKNITFYYMRENKKADLEFSELINKYMSEKNKNEEKFLYSEIKNRINSSILTVNNFDDLMDFIDGKKLNLVNDFMASINNNPEKLSPIGCLTCHGNVIIPNLHLSYWEELLEMYKEMIDLEPDSLWYNQEINMVQLVVNRLKENKVYITGV